MFFAYIVLHLRRAYRQSVQNGQFLCRLAQNVHPCWYGPSQLKYPPIRRVFCSSGRRTALSSLQPQRTALDLRIRMLQQWPAIDLAPE
jgi:hypothetical protein